MHFHHLTHVCNLQQGFFVVENLDYRDIITQVDVITLMLYYGHVSSILIILFGGRQWFDLLILLVATIYMYYYKSYAIIHPLFFPAA